MSRERRTQDLIGELVAALESDPEYDEASFLAAHPEEREELERRLSSLRRVGLLRAASHTGAEESDVLQRIRERYGIELPRVFAALHSTSDDPPDALEEWLPQGLVARRFRLIEEIGRGGMGRIVRAHDLDLDRPVALKLAPLPDELPPGGTPYEWRLERFFREARITGRLEHPGIVPVHALGLSAEGQVFFAMKIVEGESLAEVARRLAAGDEATLREFDVRRCVRIVLKLCEALGYAHSRGVVHRDLKPANVMIGRFGEIQLMDWGLARISATATDEERPKREGAPGTLDPLETAEGEVFGTPSYMAPEQARGAVAEMDERTDVFGVGALLHHLLAGLPPYRGRDRDAVLARAVGGRLDDPLFSTAHRRVPAELRAVCAKALARERDARYASVRELGQDLEAWLEDRQGRAWKDAAPVRVAKLARRHPAAAFGVLAALLALTATGLGIGVAQLSRESAARDLAEQDALLSANLDALIANRHEATRVGPHDPYTTAREHMANLADHGTPLEPPEDVRVAARRLQAIQERNPATFQVAMDAIYATATQLELGSVNRASETPAQVEPHPEGWQPSSNVELVHHLFPELAELWPRLVELIDIVESDPWRRGVWTAWLGYLSGATVSLRPYLTDEAISARTDREVFWLAGLLRRGMGRGNRTELELLRRAVRLNPGHFWPHFLLAVYAEERGELPLALEHARAAVASEPSSVLARSNLGAMLDAAGRIEEARDVLREAYELSPEDHHVRVNLGKVLHLVGDHDEGVALLASELEADPEDFGITILLGDALVSRHHAGDAPDRSADLERAAELAREALVMRPTGVEPYRLGARVLLEPDGEVLLWDAFDALELPGGEAWDRLGSQLLAMNANIPRDKAVELALQALDTAVEVDPADGGTWLGLGESLLLLDQLEQAEDCLMRAHELRPQDAAVDLLRALVARRQGDAPRAEEHRARALGLEPELLREVLLPPDFARDLEWARTGLD